MESEANTEKATAPPLDPCEVLPAECWRRAFEFLFPVSEEELAARTPLPGLRSTCRLFRGLVDAIDRTGFLDAAEDARRRRRFTSKRWVLLERRGLRPTLFSPESDAVLGRRLFELSFCVSKGEKMRLLHRKEFEAFAQRSIERGRVEVVYEAMRRSPFLFAFSHAIAPTTTRLGARIPFPEDLVARGVSEVACGIGYAALVPFEATWEFWLSVREEIERNRPEPDELGDEARWMLLMACSADDAALEKALASRRDRGIQEPIRAPHEHAVDAVIEVLRSSEAPEERCVRTLEAAWPWIGGPSDAGPRRVDWTWFIAACVARGRVATVLWLKGRLGQTDAVVHAIAPDSNAAEALNVVKDAVWKRRASRVFAAAGVDVVGPFVRAALSAPPAEDDDDDGSDDALDVLSAAFSLGDDALLGEVLDRLPPAILEVAGERLEEGSDFGRILDVEGCRRSAKSPAVLARPRMKGIIFELCYQHLFDAQRKNLPNCDTDVLCEVIQDTFEISIPDAAPELEKIHCVAVCSATLEQFEARLVRMGRLWARVERSLTDEDCRFPETEDSPMSKGHRLRVQFQEKLLFVAQRLFYSRRPDLFSALYRAVEDIERGTGPFAAVARLTRMASGDGNLSQLLRSRAHFGFDALPPRQVHPDSIAFLADGPGRGLHRFLACLSAHLGNTGLNPSSQSRVGQLMEALAPAMNDPHYDARPFVCPRLLHCALTRCSLAPFKSCVRSACRRVHAGHVGVEYRRLQGGAPIVSARGDFLESLTKSLECWGGVFALLMHAFYDPLLSSIPVRRAGAKFLWITKLLSLSPERLAKSLRIPSDAHPCDWDELSRAGRPLSHAPSAPDARVSHPLDGLPDLNPEDETCRPYLIVKSNPNPMGADIVTGNLYHRPVLQPFRVFAAPRPPLNPVEIFSPGKGLDLAIERPSAARVLESPAGPVLEPGRDLTPLLHPRLEEVAIPEPTLRRVQEPIDELPTPWREHLSCALRKRLDVDASRAASSRKRKHAEK